MYCLLRYVRDQVSKQVIIPGKAPQKTKEIEDERTGGPAMHGEQVLCYDGLEGSEEDHGRDVEHSSLVLRV